MNDIECVLCEKPCESFGPHPICRKCTRRQAAYLPPLKVMQAGLDGIDELRSAVRALNACNESFNQRFTAEQLVMLYRALRRSKWDILPDRWTQDEIDLALEGRGSGATSAR